MNIKEVVFPVDFSDRSIDAGPYVAALTRRLRAKLTLLHVVESLPPGSSPLDRLYTGDDAELAQRKETANEALSAFQQQYIPHVPSELCVLVGDPATCIVIYGGESKGRLIVMPTRGFGPFRQMLLGSVTAKVLHDALSRVDRSSSRKGNPSQTLAEAAAHHVCCRTRLGNGRSLETVCRASGSAWNATHRYARNHASRRRLASANGPRRTANIN